MQKYRNARWVAVVGLLGVISLIVYTFFIQATSKTPEFSGKTLSGEVVSPASLQNKVVLVTFWATDCATCIQEMPMMKELHGKYQAQGYETLAVAMSYDRPEFIKTYVEKNQLPFTVVFDEDKSIAKAFEKVQLTPTNFLLNKKGQIIKQYIGIPDRADLEKAIETALAEEGVAQTQAQHDHPAQLVVWKSPDCGCCADWIEHIQSHGITVQAHNTYQLAEQRAKLGMPSQYASCHTAMIDGYVVEGHVPAQDIQRLLAEKPEAIGLSVPGMPIGSPGMDGFVYKGQADRYNVLLVKHQSHQVFASYPKTI